MKHQVSVADTSSCAIGGPCAGKGFYCGKAVKELEEVEHACMGDILRAERDRPGSQWAEQIQEHIHEGSLVPGELSVDLLQMHILEKLAAGRTKFIVDGFPRKIEQAVSFEKRVI